MASVNGYMVVKFTNEVFRQSRTCLHRTTAVLGLRKAGMAVRIRLKALGLLLALHATTLNGKTE